MVKKLRRQNAAKMSNQNRTFALEVFFEYSKLVTSYKIGEVHFRLLGTNDFLAKVKNERFTATGWL